MLNTIMTILFFIILLLWSSLMFFLANIDRFGKEDLDMDKNVINVTPDKDGKIFITLYGTKYQIVIKEKPVTKPAKADK